MALPARPNPPEPEVSSHVQDPDSDAENKDTFTCWPCPACSHVSETAKGLRSHYDMHHSPQLPEVTTIFHSSCPSCQQVFVTARDAKRHKCPAFIHSVEQLEKSQASLPLLMVGSLTLMAQVLLTLMDLLDGGLLYGLYIMWISLRF